MTGCPPKGKYDNESEREKNLIYSEEIILNLNVIETDDLLKAIVYTQCQLKKTREKSKNLSLVFDKIIEQLKAQRSSYAKDLREHAEKRFFQELFDRPIEEMVIYVAKD